MGVREASTCFTRIDIACTRLTFLFFLSFYHTSLACWIRPLLSVFAGACPFERKRVWVSFSILSTDLPQPVLLLRMCEPFFYHIIPTKALCVIVDFFFLSPVNNSLSFLSLSLFFLMLYESDALLYGDIWIEAFLSRPSI
jgi:hypothetical protein